MYTISLQEQLQLEIEKQGADFVHFVDISKLAKKQNRGYPHAVLIGVLLTKGYLEKVSGKQDYVGEMIQNKQIEEDEFHLAELKTDRVADHIANYITMAGFDACSQSEDNLAKTGHYKFTTKTTPLPHKTIAGLAGLGWIGKHNLLVSPQFGSAINMCTVLTNAPLKTILKEPIEPQCGNCHVCVDVCEEKALKGKTWEQGLPREELIDVFLCTTCIKCLVFCPWTQLYMGQ